MKKLLWFLPFTLFACASFEKGMLVQFDGRSPLDANQVDRHCEMDDHAACLMLGKPTMATIGSVPIIQGMAPMGRAVFAVLLKRDQSAKWFLYERATLSLRQLNVAKVQTNPQSLYRIETVEASELSPGTTYELVLVDKDGELLDHRTFKTIDTDRKNFRFALISCADDRFGQEQIANWKDLISQEPQAILAIGDNVYANRRANLNLGATIDPNTLWERYSETRATLSIFRNYKLIPFFATWDDNDFGMSDGDETYEHKDAARQTMETFFPVLADAKTILEGPGVSKALKIGGQAFVLLDNRSFRSKNGTPPVCRKNPRHSLCQGRNSTKDTGSTHFGRIQEDWALSLVEKHNGPLWLISGDQWFGGYHPFESYEGNHPENFSRFLEKLQTKITKAAKENVHPIVIFASGDRHLSEIMKVKPFRRSSYQTYEFTSSPIHAATYPDSWKEFPNSRQLVGKSGVMNFSIMNTMVLPDGTLHLEAQSRGSGGEVLYERSFHLKPVVAPAKAKRKEILN